MKKHFHTVVLGGGCLGVAAAVSIARRLKKKSAVCLLEKEVVGAGLSSRHSGIVRCANASRTAAQLGRIASEMWRSIKDCWHVNIPYRRAGAVWIVPVDRDHPSEQWFSLQRSLVGDNIAFESLNREEAGELTKNAVRLSQDEIFFHEPDALLLEAPQVLEGLRSALRSARVEILEHTRPVGFDLNREGRIGIVRTDRGDLTCDHVVNALGAWSREVFSKLGMDIPVSLEPVVVANWLAGTNDLPEGMPIVADFVNRAYFRSVGARVLHMHQPRSRSPDNISSNFENPPNADRIYRPSNYAVRRGQLKSYLAMVRYRFPGIDKPAYAGGFRSFFDITPDLKFILGPDSGIRNLIHCLGAGQSLKYAPLFGALCADWIFEGKPTVPTPDVSEFSISRFQSKNLADFWNVFRGRTQGL